MILPLRMIRVHMCRQRVRTLHDIRVRNSLERESHTSLGFLLDSDTGATTRTLNWYSCGPTVYDSSHLGNARTYVCKDIIRRILQGFYGIPVNYAMGLTDVDDKIIARAEAAGQGGSWDTMT